MEIVRIRNKETGEIKKVTQEELHNHTVYTDDTMYEILDSGEECKTKKGTEGINMIDLTTSKAMNEEAELTPEQIGWVLFANPGIILDYLIAKDKGV